LTRGSVPSCSTPSPTSVRIGSVRASGHYR